MSMDILVKKTHKDKSGSRCYKKLRIESFYLMKKKAEDIQIFLGIASSGE